MPINFKCPNCGQATELPDAAINRRARCTSCHSVYAVRDVVQGSSQPIPSQPVLAPDGSMSSRETLVVGLSISVFAILFLAFITYWFGYRDTWETDNFSNIIARCEAVLDASYSSDDDAATQAYDELTAFIGNRSIKTQSLATRLENADQAIAPILARLEQEKRKREAKAQAEQLEREARERSARRVRAQNDYSSFYNPDRNPPYMANGNLGYQTRSGAIAAYAYQFDRTSRWVETHMGSSNDLGDININLVGARLREDGIDLGF